ncbi:alpha amylase N-terminal ig-like domain-containing protein [Thermococcus celer]|uniref:Alpha-glycosidase n=1 Tax=Thermococcus celer Vu 13 = JCM 8558 TaxID=1293037 RepID=A0A218P3M5_THECE|nr:alpha amylase N-terminal ig-like domain-containing protein [Thermococcus celer]ASI99531.1 alpha-glycosidase [Thermococcus celer] [Thermococcus celer Vu 13 = JCM 8558]
MYKIFGFRDDGRFGRVAEVEFSIPAGSEEGYAYLLGNFNAFNEGSFRMMMEGRRWSVRLELPEGLWYYGFSVDGEFLTDPENPEKRVYRRPSYRFERKVSVARIIGDGDFFHGPSATYLYSLWGRTHVILRVRRGKARGAVLRTEDREIEMRLKARDEFFEYFEGFLPGDGPVRYSFLVESEGGTIEYGPFNARPYKLEAPDWVFGRVFYQIMPDRFRRGHGPKEENTIPGGNFHGGDLWGIIEKLDHLENLGINALYLTPIFASMTYHRYDITDYFRVDERLGGEAAFVKLIGELRKRGIRLVLDGVFHHTSFFHPYFQDVVKKGEESEYKGFYRITGFPVVSREFMEILNSGLPLTEKYIKLKKLDWNYESFYSVWLMPRLNHDNPEVRRFIGGVMRHWLEKGADGWRLDVAHGVPPGLWREVKESLPGEAYLFGEVMDDARPWLFDVFHGTMNYPLYDLILRFFVEGSIDSGEFLNGLELLSTHYGPTEYVMYNFLDNHDTERFIDLVGDEEKYLCALAFLMTYRGIPAIFYGDEIGLRGSTGGGMSSGRTPMEWDDEKWNRDVLKATEELVRLRRKSRALQRGEFIPLSFEDGLLLYERVYGDEGVLVGINYSGERRRVNIPWRYLSGGTLELEPWSFAVLEG